VTKKKGTSFCELLGGTLLLDGTELNSVRSSERKKKIFSDRHGGG